MLGRSCWFSFLISHPGAEPNSPPTSMVQMEKIFSESVFADTLPKPTLVRLLRAKYREVI